jgi:hypothetical protein
MRMQRASSTWTWRYTRYEATEQRDVTIPDHSQPVAVLHKRRSIDTKQEELFPAPPQVVTVNPESIYDQIVTQPTSLRELLQEVELAIDETELARSYPPHHPFFLHRTEEHSPNVDLSDGSYK